MFVKFDLAPLKNSLILQQIFFAVGKHCAANSVLITQPKNKEVLKVLDTIQRRLQCEGTDINTFFRLEK